MEVNLQIDNSRFASRCPKEAKGRTKKGCTKKGRTKKGRTKKGRTKGLHQTILITKFRKINTVCLLIEQCKNFQRGCW